MVLNAIIIKPNIFYCCWNYAPYRQNLANGGKDGLFLTNYALVKEIVKVTLYTQNEIYI